MFGFQRRNRKERANAALDISVERLESRVMLTANVSVVGSNVTITGETGNDTLVIFNTGLSIQVSDGILTQDTGLSSIANLTVNTLGGDDVVLFGEVTPLPINITGNLVINTNSGNDAVLANNVFVLQSVTINTGTHADIVTFGGQVAQDVTMLTGSGNNTVVLNGLADTANPGGSDLLVGGSVSITGGADSDIVITSLDVDPTDGDPIITGIGGNLTVNTLGGDDMLLFGNNQTTVVNGNLVANSANGNDFVVSAIAAGGSLIVGGDVTFDTGTDDDVNLVQFAQVAGKLRMTDASGTNTMAIIGASVADDAAINGGSGEENIVVAGSVFVADLVVRANAGDDTVTYDLGTVVMASGLPRLTLDGGAGNDTLAPNSAIAPPGVAFILDNFGATITNFEVT